MPDSAVENSNKQLDFRDINEHPPVDTSSAIVDPSWDAQKVYFNEFESTKPQKGDEFDDIFQTNDNVTESDLAIQLVQLQQLREDNGPSGVVDDDRLDPLGWPRADVLPTSFTEFPEAKVEVGNIEEDDDAGLLGSGGIEEGEASKATHVGGVCTTVTNLFCGAGATPWAEAKEETSADADDVQNGEKILSKQERIKLYENICRDEESSVDEEEEADDDSDAEEEAPKYTAQDDDDDSHSETNWEVPNFELSINPNPVPVTSQETTVVSSVAMEFATFDVSGLESANALTVGQNNPKPKKKSLPKVKLRQAGDKEAPKKATSLLLQPPPPEKLKQWEDAKARRSNGKTT